MSDFSLVEIALYQFMKMDAAPLVEYQELCEQVLPLLENQKADASGCEGLVLKDLDGLYEIKRVNHQVKWTPEEFVDVRVVEVLEGKGKLAGHVGRFVIEYEGRICEAGPGKATHKQLKEYWTKPPSMIEVKYREVTPDGALLFPVFNINLS